MQNSGMENRGINLRRFDGYISRQDREQLHGHKGAVVWFTGLPASGKSTISHLVEKQLHKMGCCTYVLDGDNIRYGLCSDLGFSPEDRSRNVHRIGEAARLFVDAGLIVLTAFISPYRKDREYVRGLFGEGEFIEVYLRCPVEVCESRDLKGFYKKAKEGLLREYTGVSAPYEPPEDPELVISTDRILPEEAAPLVIGLLGLRSEQC